MSVYVIEFGRQEDGDYVPIGPTKEIYEEVVGSTHALVCQNCGAPLTRGTYKCEYCGTEHMLIGFWCLVIFAVRWWM